MDSRLSLMLVLSSLVLMVRVSISVAAVADLPKLNVVKNQISVSGFSSGAVMATQMHVAFSSEIMGAGLIGGVPYLCSPLLSCMTTPSLFDARIFRTRTASALKFKNIDSTSNLKDDRVWILAGRLDTVVDPENGILIKEYYSSYVNNNNQIILVDDIPSAHGHVTKNYGGSCNEIHPSNFMNNCDYNAAYHLLEHMYPGLKEQPTPSDKAEGTLLEFDQSAFTRDDAYMDTVGYIYIPTGCEDRVKACRLHVAFHGCNMGREFIGDEYVRHAGYNEVGEQNDIIVLYPQVGKSRLNQVACWDWYGYTGVSHAFRSGPQMKAVHDMIHRLIGK